MLNPNEKIDTINVAEEVWRSLLDYPLSVIISRALTDTRAGLKPSPRRYPYPMPQSLLYSERRPYECCTIFGTSHH